MLLKADRIIIRDLERKDKENLFKIVWQKNVVRFMCDWSEYNTSPISNKQPNMESDSYYYYRKYRIES